MVAPPPEFLKRHFVSLDEGQIPIPNQAWREDEPKTV